MSNDLLRNNSVVAAQLKTDLPDFKVGSVIEVDYKIVEGGKERVQTFKGLVINRKSGVNMDGTFTVLKDSSFKIKVERTFPLHSPFIVAIRVILKQQAHRANIRNMAKLKDPIKSVRTRPFVQRDVVPAQYIPKVKENLVENTVVDTVINDEVVVEQTEAKTENQE